MKNAVLYIRAAFTEVFSANNNRVRTMNYKIIKGDLFTCPQEASLAHCVSKDFHMSKGIAVPFKEKFKGVQDLISQNVKKGECAYLRREDRYIFYLVTKKKYWGKPTLQSLASSLESMRDHCLNFNVRELCMPKIAAGLDELCWEDVEGIIKKVFVDIPIDITIYEL